MIFKQIVEVGRTEAAQERSDINKDMHPKH